MNNAAMNLYMSLSAQSMYKYIGYTSGNRIAKLSFQVGIASNLVDDTKFLQGGSTLGIIYNMLMNMRIC